MAYKKVTLTDLPKRSRKAVPRFARTAEWKMMKADLGKGLKPNEALQISMDDADKAKYRITNRRTIARFIHKYLLENKLPYRLTSFTREGRDYFIVRDLRS